VPDGSLQALSATSGTILVTNNDAVIRGFRLSDTGNVAPVRKIGGPNTELTNPTGIAVAPDGRIGVSNVNNSGGAVHVEVFAPGASGNVQPIAAISCGGTTIPLGAAFDTNGNLYVTNGKRGNDITVFAPSANGCVSGNRIIGGQNTTLNQPFGITVAPTGAVYVVSAAGASAAVFAPGASGDVAPNVVITGDKTGFIAPADVALNAKNEVLVTEFRANSILVFAANANGNVAPIRSITGPRTGLDGPNGIALDGAGNIYVSNMFANTVTVYAPTAIQNAAPIRTIAGPLTGLSAPYKLAISK
jgi:sugar lactone lactonase YvrE